MGVKIDWFPITLKAPASFIQEMRGYEESSYYDQIEAIERGLEPEFDPNKHTYTILSRYKTRIVLKDEEELADFYYRLGSGLIKEHSDQSYSCAVRLQDELHRDIVTFNPEVCKKWRIRG